MYKSLFFIAAFLLGLLASCTFTSINDDYVVDETGASVKRTITSSSMFSQAQLPNIDKVTVKSNEIKSSGFDWIDAGTSMWIIFTIGGLAVIAGIVIAVWMRQLWTGIYVGLGGILLIAIGVLFETYPWVVLVLPVLAVGAIVYFIYAANTKKKLTNIIEVTNGGTTEPG